LAQLPIVFDTVVHMLADAGSRAGAAVAVSCDGETLTYTEFIRCVGGFATELQTADNIGDRVALICGNSIDMAIAMFAVHAAGMQEVPVNPIYTRRELGHILSDAAPVAVVYDDSVSNLIEEICGELGISRLIKIGGEGGRRLTDWREDNGAGLPQPFPDPDSLATLQYTGGTTGLPKGVNITHRQIATNISQREARWRTRPDREFVLCVMPLFHVYASSMCLHLSVYCRGTIIIHRQYHPEAVLAAIEQDRISLLPVGPTIFNGLMAHEKFPGTDFSSLHRSYSGSAPLPEETLKQWEALTGCQILEAYGQSETGPVLTANPDDRPIVPGSVGVPLPQTEIEIVDVGTGTNVLAVGEEGEIRARGPQIMSGYRNRPEETAQSLRDGWLYTGDIGRLDEDGILYITDRKKDMVIVGGYNVYPREIDEVLFAHPDILEAAAVGVPDSYRGEIIHAFVVLRRSIPDAELALTEYCSAELAKYKVPARFHIVDQLMKTTIGKIDKAAMRQSLATD